VPNWIIAAAANTAASDSSNPFHFVTDFFKSPTWHFITYMAIFFVVVIWIAGAYWIFKDSRRRIDDWIIVVVCVLAGLVFGPVGWIVYAIARPPEYLVDVQEREMELHVLEGRMAEDSRCSFCKSPVKDDYLLCPNCGHRLRGSCPQCHRPIEPQWRVCPFCEADVHAAPAATEFDRAYQ
jgi:RNA polymerase subunit RPABC4/transcription elongation factor Spt4